MHNSVFPFRAGVAYIASHPADRITFFAVYADSKILKVLEQFFDGHLNLVFRSPAGKEFTYFLCDCGLNGPFHSIRHTESTVLPLVRLVMIIVLSILCHLSPPPPGESFSKAKLNKHEPLFELIVSIDEAKSAKILASLC